MGGCGSSAGQGRREEGLSSAFVDNTTEDVVDTSHEVWAAFTPSSYIALLVLLVNKRKNSYLLLRLGCVFISYFFLREEPLYSFTRNSAAARCSAS